jgi:hypothetical protein
LEFQPRQLKVLGKKLDKALPNITASIAESSALLAKQ